MTAAFRDYRAAPSLENEKLLQATRTLLPSAPCPRCADRGWCKHRQPDAVDLYHAAQARAAEPPSQAGNVG